MLLTNIQKNDEERHLVVNLTVRYSNMEYSAIKELPSKTGEEIVIRGWLHRVRRQGKMIFFIIKAEVALAGLNRILRPQDALIL